MSSFILDNCCWRATGQVGIQGCSALGMGCVYCVPETLYIHLELEEVLLKVVCMGIVNRS